MNLLIYIEKILDKLQSILHTLAGWVVGLLLFLGDFIGGHELAVGLVVFVTLMDAVWGITVSIKKKRFALSELARLTIGKLAVYGCAMLTFIGLDNDARNTHTTARGGYMKKGERLLSFFFTTRQHTAHSTHYSASPKSRQTFQTAVPNSQCCGYA